MCKIEFRDSGPDPKRPDRNVTISANTCTHEGVAQVRKADVAIDLSLKDSDIRNNPIACP
jgi:hypothetical protein